MAFAPSPVAGSYSDRSLLPGALAGLGPTLGWIFLVSFLAGSLVSGLLAAPPGTRENMAEHDRVMEEEIRLDRRPLPRTARDQRLTYGVVHGKAITGYLAEPAVPLPGNPAVVVIHEWWGLNDWVRLQADRLARKGYRALAVDLYGGGVAEDADPARARQQAMGYMQAARKDHAGTLDNLGDALRYLKVRGASRVGVIGWCMGGGFALDAALAHPALVDACVIYYGHVSTEASALAPLRAPILGNFGELDSGIPPATVKAFEDALRGAGKAYDIRIYKGAGHAFANPNQTSAHREEDARHAWGRTLAFLQRTLERQD